MSLMKNFFMYSASALLLRSASMLVAPLTLHLLSPQEYGLVSLLHSFSSIVTIGIGFGLRQALSIEFFHHGGIQQRILINTILCAYILLATPMCLCALCYSHLINRYIFSNAVTNPLIGITMLYCFIFFFVELLYQILRYQEKVRMVTCIQTGSALAIIICNCILLIWLRAGIYSAMTSYCIGYGLVCIWGLYKYWHSSYKSVLYRSDSIKKIPTYLMMGLPFIPTVVCSWILSASDRWLLARMTTLHDVGIYALADSFGQLYMLIILQPLSNAYLPQLMSSFKNPHTRITTEQYNRKRTISGMIIIAILISLGFLVLKPVFNMLMPTAYHQTFSYLWYILIGYVFLTGTYCFSALIQFHKCRRFLSFSLVLPALFNLFLNILFIPIAGLQGCVIATLLSQALYCGITYWYGGRILKSLAVQSYKIPAIHEYSRE